MSIRTNIIKGMNKILELVEYAKANSNSDDKEINFGIVSNSLAQEINKETGVFVRGAKKKLTASGIRHALAGHGNDKLERQRGQTGLTNEDFDLIPSILSIPDIVIKGNKSRNGRSISVVFVKTIKGNTFHVAMAKSAGDLVFTTMFIKK